MLAGRTRLIPLALALVLTGVGCSGSGSGSDARTEHQRMLQAKRAFYEQAAAGGWTIVGRSDFEQLAPGLPKRVIPREPGATKASRLIDSHGFHSLDISPDGERFAALTYPIGAPFQDAHLLVFDRDFKVVYEDPAQTNIGQKGDNTRSALRWSPDGKYLVYAQTGKVWVIDPAQGSRRELANDHQMKLTFAAPSWGPAGKLVYENAARELTIIDLDGGAAKLLGHGRFPSWSPDGSRIVYRKDSGEVFAHELEHARETKLFELNLHHPDYLWTPDSRYVLFDQKIYNSHFSNYYVYSFADELMIDLRERSGGLKGRLIEALPPWLESRLVPLEAGDS